MPRPVAIAFWDFFGNVFCPTHTESFAVQTKSETAALKKVEAKTTQAVSDMKEGKKDSKNI